MHRSVTFGLYGVVIAGLVGGAVTWATVDKSVTLSVDGQDKVVHTLSGTVKGTLADAGYTPGPHDIVAPSLDAGIHDQSQIVLRRGRLLKIWVDGKEREVWVNAPTVSEALSDLGYSVSSFSSVSRSKRLPLSPTTIDLRTPKDVTLVHDGLTQHLLTTAASVSQVIADAQVSVGNIDEVSQPIFAPPTENMQIVIKRVTTGQVTEAQPLPFGTTSQPDGTMVQGRTVVMTPGVNGSQNVTYAVVYVDGVLTGKTPVSSAVVTAPQNQVQRVGTAAPPAAAPSGGGGGGAPISVSPGSAQAIAQQMLADRGWGNDQFSCLVSLWNRESGWRTNASNPSGAYGIPQALPGSKMASAGPNWQSDPTTQITWGLGYISGRYSTPCGAWAHSQATGWY